MTDTHFKKKCLVPSQRVCFRLKSLRQEKQVSLSELEINYIYKHWKIAVFQIFHRQVFTRKILSKSMSKLLEKILLVLSINL